jgi:hypothetical protein
VVSPCAKSNESLFLNPLQSKIFFISSNSLVQIHFQENTETSELKKQLIHGRSLGTSNMNGHFLIHCTVHLKFTALLYAADYQLHANTVIYNKVFFRRGVDVVIICSLQVNIGST